MKKALLLTFLFLVSLCSPMMTTTHAQMPEDGEMSVLHTAVNPANNNTYHLLTASSWEDAASYARSLDGFLVTVDDDAENTWLFETFSSWDNTSRHLWIGLSDHSAEGEYRWHDGTPFLYRNWGDAQPSEGGDEHFVHIASTNMGNIMPGSWNDLENDPQYFPVYGVVEIGPGADYALRFDGAEDHVVMDHNDRLDMENITHLELSAWVHPYGTEGNQFILMKGDYGWGMYLSDNRLAFSSEYSLSQHPVSDGIVEADEWSHVQVNVVVGEGYTFRINGNDAGVVIDDDATIPLGDFGSNNCYENDLACDEFFVARMGAGCECNYFEGLLDNITVRAGTDNSTMEERVHLEFPEGEGGETSDNIHGHVAIIEGADWVMPDGSIVAQAEELFIGEAFELAFAAAGDTLLFFVEIEEYTREVEWYSYSLKFDDFEEMTEYTLYALSNEVPDAWNHDTATEGEFGFVYESWSWPDEGVMWFTVVLDTDVEDLYIELDADIADPPPTLDDMTELKESIPVTNQNINGDSYNNGDVNINYYYINVTQPLADLRVRTYDGRGNVDIGMSYYSPPTPVFWWDEQDGGEEKFDENGDEIALMEAWSTNPGNDEEVHLFDVEVGLYYITAYSFRNAREFTIVADFVYPPENVEPEDAVVLTPGVEYGPLSGYDGLNQYFKVDVPQGTERLIVSLADGAGEASLYMRLDQAPTSSTYDHHSTSEGADDRIAFNDPTPGWWYILLDSPSAFTGVHILAEFAERYVWDYDGTPLELYNDEPLDGVAVSKGESVLFFADLEEPGNIFWLETSGGSGDVMLTVEGLQYELAFNEGGGRPGSGENIETETSDFTITSGKEGTNHLLSVEAPMNGRIDITMTGISDATEISILARWDETFFPVEPLEPEAPAEPLSVATCVETMTELFDEHDANDDGLLDENELKSTEISAEEFKSADIDKDGAIEFREVLQFSCTCDNELRMVFDAFALGGDEVSIRALASHEWANEFDFESVNINDDGYIDGEELDLLAVLCDTTYDAFDGDGDGVPDEVDAFPNDPSESKDTDGDGVGDNADIVASVSNDIIYASAGVVFLLLTALLVGFLRNGAKSGSEEELWDGQDRMTETMFGEQRSSDYRKEEVALPSSTTVSVESKVDHSVENQDLMSALAPTQTPPEELMGMVLDGVETVEFPTGSGNVWVRDSPDVPWSPKP